MPVRIAQRTARRGSAVGWRATDGSLIGRTPRTRRTIVCMDGGMDNLIDYGRKESNRLPAAATLYTPLTSRADFTVACACSARSLRLQIAIPGHLDRHDRLLVGIDGAPGVDVELLAFFEHM